MQAGREWEEREHQRQQGWSLKGRNGKDQNQAEGECHGGDYKTNREEGGAGGHSDSLPRQLLLV